LGKAATRGVCWAGGTGEDPKGDQVRTGGETVSLTTDSSARERPPGPPNWPGFHPHSVGFPGQSAAASVSPFGRSRTCMVGPSRMPRRDLPPGAGSASSSRQSPRAEADQSPSPARPRVKTPRGGPRPHQPRASAAVTQPASGEEARSRERLLACDVGGRPALRRQARSSPGARAGPRADWWPARWRRRAAGRQFARRRRW
jgi:hypothetical protein